MARRKTLAKRVTKKPTKKTKTSNRGAMAAGILGATALAAGAGYMAKQRKDEDDDIRRLRANLAGSDIERAARDVLDQPMQEIYSIRTYEPMESIRPVLQPKSLNVLSPADLDTTREFFDGPDFFF